MERDLILHGATVVEDKLQNGIHLIASLTSGLSRHHEEFAVAVVDEVLEKIRVGLELNEYGTQQKRLAHLRFLGELYNYEHVDSSVIFETLDLTLSYGHGTSEQEVLDPPEDFFRARMVIILLVTCGHYFDRGSSKKRLDQFLIHFQRYISKLYATSAPSLPQHYAAA